VKGRLVPTTDLFKVWLQPVPAGPRGIRLYDERPGARKIGLVRLKKLLAEHFVGEATVAKAGGYAKSAKIILNSLPTLKRTQSGDLAELIATEYVNSETSFRVLINKLRWKSDRQMPMHGNDVIAVDTTALPTRVLKGECKSRGKLSDSVVAEAAETLDSHGGRPNPSTLAFITKRLYEENRDDEAAILRDLQCDGALLSKNIVHCIFALAGNDPTKALGSAPKPKQAGIRREGVGVTIPDHGGFVEAVFATYGARS